MAQPSYAYEDAINDPKVAQQVQDVFDSANPPPPPSDHPMAQFGTSLFGPALAYGEPRDVPPVDLGTYNPTSAWSPSTIGRPAPLANPYGAASTDAGASVLNIAKGAGQGLQDFIAGAAQDPSSPTGRFLVGGALQGLGTAGGVVTAPLNLPGALGTPAGRAAAIASYRTLEGGQPGVFDIPAVDRALQAGSGAAAGAFGQVAEDPNASLPQRALAAGAQFATGALPNIGARVPLLPHGLAGSALEGAGAVGRGLATQAAKVPGVESGFLAGEAGGARLFGDADRVGGKTPLQVAAALNKEASARDAAFAGTRYQTVRTGGAGSTVQTVGQMESGQTGLTSGTTAKVKTPEYATHNAQQVAPVEAARQQILDANERLKQLTSPETTDFIKAAHDPIDQLLWYKTHRPDAFNPEFIDQAALGPQNADPGAWQAHQQAVIDAANQHIQGLRDTMSADETARAEGGAPVNGVDVAQHYPLIQADNPAAASLVAQQTQARGQLLNAMRSAQEHVPGGVIDLKVAGLVGPGDEISHITGGLASRIGGTGSLGVGEGAGPVQTAAQRAGVSDLVARQLASLRAGGATDSQIADFGRTMAPAAERRGVVTSAEGQAVYASKLTRALQTAAGTEGVPLSRHPVFAQYGVEGLKGPIVAASHGGDIGTATRAVMAGDPDATRLLGDPLTNELIQNKVAQIIRATGAPEDVIRRGLALKVANDGAKAADAAPAQVVKAGEALTPPPPSVAEANVATIRDAVQNPAAPPRAPVGLDASLPRELAGAKPRYRGSQLVFGSDIDRALYIVAQANPSRADGAYMRFLRGSLPGMTDAQIRAVGGQVRTGIGDFVRAAERRGSAEVVNVPPSKIARGNLTGRGPETLPARVGMNVTDAAAPDVPAATTGAAPNAPLAQPPRTDAVSTNPGLGNVVAALRQQGATDAEITSALRSMGLSAADAKAWGAPPPGGKPPTGIGGAPEVPPSLQVAGKNMAQTLGIQSMAIFTDMPRASILVGHLPLMRQAMPLLADAVVRGQPQEVAMAVRRTVDGVISEGRFQQMRTGQLDAMTAAGIVGAEKLLTDTLSAKEDFGLRSILGNQKIAGLYNPVANANRAYPSMMNTLRTGAALHLAQMQKMALGYVNSKAIIDAVNEVSGRGPLTRSPGLNEALVNVFFGPRLMTATFVVPLKAVRALGSIVGDIGRRPLDPVDIFRVRSLAAYVATGAGLMKMASVFGNDINLNPLSRDWGRITNSDGSRTDLWGSFGPEARLIAQEWNVAQQHYLPTGGVAGSGILSGSERPWTLLEDDPGSLLLNYLRGKLAPGLATVIGDYVLGKGKDMGGQPASLSALLPQLPIGIEAATKGGPATAPTLKGAPQTSTASGGFDISKFLTAEAGGTIVTTPQHINYDGLGVAEGQPNYGTGSIIAAYSDLVTKTRGYAQPWHGGDPLMPAPSTTIGSGANSIKLDQFTAARYVAAVGQQRDAILGPMVNSPAYQQASIARKQQMFDASLQHADKIASEQFLATDIVHETDPALIAAEAVDGFVKQGSSYKDKAYWIAALDRAGKLSPQVISAIDTLKDPGPDGKTPITVAEYLRAAPLVHEYLSHVPYGLDTRPLGTPQDWTTVALARQQESTRIDALVRSGTRPSQAQQVARQEVLQRLTGLQRNLFVAGAAVANPARKQLAAQFGTLLTKFLGSSPQTTQESAAAYQQFPFGR